MLKPTGFFNVNSLASELLISLGDKSDMSGEVDYIMICKSSNRKVL